MFEYMLDFLGTHTRGDTIEYTFFGQDPPEEFFVLLSNER